LSIDFGRSPDALGFLERLTLQLTIGAAQLPSELCQRHGDFVLQRQRPDGGWAGREGESDLYYTGFALRSLAILGLLDGPVAEKAADFLRKQMQTKQGWVDLLSLVYGSQLIQASSNIDCMSHIKTDWQSNLSGLLQELRRGDGGFAKSIEGQVGSTYQTFLVIVCMELMKQTIPEAEKAIAFLMGQRQADGGFLEIRVAKRSGTNPTAAAIAALRCLESLDAAIGQNAGEFLLDLQEERSGFAANTRMPMPDLLSTFTACVTLCELEMGEAIDWQGVEHYASSMQRLTGGFSGFELDPGEDVEYTFYGLGTMALRACFAEA
jgi:geranylgeranyl transferase type-2 subunit beta